MAETLPYAKWILDHTLYPNDFFIQSISDQIPNERWIFTSFLAYFPGPFHIKCLIIHAICSVLLIWSWLRICIRFIPNRLLSLLVLICILVLGSKLSLGDNHIYYNYLNPSLIAKSLASIGLYHFLNKKYTTSALFISVATYMQVLVGLQLFVILLGCSFLASLFMTWKWRPTTRFALIYLFVASPWIILLLGQDQIHISQQLYFEIIETRLAHHFFPSYFPLKQWVVNIPFISAGCWLWFKLNKKVFFFYCLTIIGCLIYTLNVELVISNTLLKTQWFKSTLWLEALSFVAIGNWFYNHISSKKNSKLLFPLVLGFILLIGVYFFRSAEFDEPFYTLNEEKRVAQALNTLPDNSVLIIPPDLTSIRYYSGKDIFIDYKSNLHSTAYLSEAHYRRGKLYGASSKTRESTSDFGKYLENFYRTLSTKDLRWAQEKGATHILCKQLYKEWPVVLKVGEYYVFELK